MAISTTIKGGHIDTNYFTIWNEETLTACIHPGRGCGMWEFENGYGQYKSCGRVRMPFSLGEGATAKQFADQLFKKTFDHQDSLGSVDVRNMDKKIITDFCKKYHKLFWKRNEE